MLDPDTGSQEATGDQREAAMERIRIQKPKPRRRRTDDDLPSVPEAEPISAASRRLLLKDVEDVLSLVDALLAEALSG